MPSVELQAKNQRPAALSDRADNSTCTIEAHSQVRRSRKTAVKPSPVSERSPADVPSEGPEDYSAFVGLLGTQNPKFVDGLVAQLLSVSARDGGKFDVGSFLLLSLSYRAANPQTSSRQCKSPKWRPCMRP